MVAYSQTVLDIQDSVPALRGTGFVRQFGALSSFHIPDVPLSDAVWKRRYGPHTRSIHHCRLQRDERRMLTRLASASGCRLIINPDIKFAAYGSDARRTRLESLVKFLKSCEVQGVEIALNTQMTEAHSLTLVGDWFCAESVSGRAGHGYDQTTFTRHAPSMAQRIEAFDEEFATLPRDSRQSAIDKLQQVIAGIP
jgi:hypothetical protein